MLRLNVCDLGQHGCFLVYDIFWKNNSFLYYNEVWKHYDALNVVIFAVFQDHYFCGLTLFAIIECDFYFFIYITWIIWTLTTFEKSRLLRWKVEVVMYRIHFISASGVHRKLWLGGPHECARSAHRERVSAKLYVDGVQGPALGPLPGSRGRSPQKLSKFSNFKPWLWPFFAWNLALLGFTQ